MNFRQWHDLREAKRKINLKKELSYDEMKSKISVLNSEQVLDLIYQARQKGSKEFQDTINSIIDKKTDLVDEDVFNLLSYSENKEQTADRLGSNMNKLDDLSVRYLLRRFEEMANIIIEKKTNLTDDNVYDLLYFHSSMETAEKLGSENISKLNSEHIDHLLADEKYRETLKEILSRYYKDKKTLENILSRYYKKPRVK